MTTSPIDNPSVLAQARKAIAGVITPAVTYAVVKLLHGTEELAISLSAVLSGAAVYYAKNALGHLNLP